MWISIYSIAVEERWTICFRWIEMMAPVFSRPAWRCVWYMIQVHHSDLLMLLLSFTISITLQRLHIYSLSVVYFTEWLDPCMGSRYAAWVLCSGKLNSLFFWFNFIFSWFSIFLHVEYYSTLMVVCYILFPPLFWPYLWWTGWSNKKSWCCGCWIHSPLQSSYSWRHR